MRRILAAAAVLCLMACSGEPLTGVAAQDAVSRHRETALALENAIVLLDGREMSEQEVRALDPASIASVEVFKGKAAKTYLPGRPADVIIVIASKAAQGAR